MEWIEEGAGRVLYLLLTQLTSPPECDPSHHPLVYSGEVRMKTDNASYPQPVSLDRA